MWERKRADKMVSGTAKGGKNVEKKMCIESRDTAIVCRTEERGREIR